MNFYFVFRIRYLKMESKIDNEAHKNDEAVDNNLSPSKEVKFDANSGKLFFLLK